MPGTGMTCLGFSGGDGLGAEVEVVLTSMDSESIHSSHSNTENLFFQQGMPFTAGGWENPPWVVEVEVTLLGVLPGSLVV